MEKIPEILAAGGVSVAVIFSLIYLFKTIGFKIRANGSSGSNTLSLDNPLIKQGIEIGSELSKNSIKQTLILENLVIAIQRNGERLERIETKLSTAMERQIDIKKDIQDIKREVITPD